MQLKDITKVRYQAYIRCINLANLNLIFISASGSIGHVKLVLNFEQILMF